MGIIIQGPIPQQIEGARQKHFEQLSWVTREVRQDSVYASNQDLSLEGSYLVCWHARNAVRCLLPMFMLAGVGQYLQLYGEMPLAGPEGRTLL